MRTSESFIMICSWLGNNWKVYLNMIEITSDLQGVSLSALNFTKCQFLALGTTPCTVGLTQQWKPLRNDMWRCTYKHRFILQRKFFFLQQVRLFLVARRCVKSNSCISGRRRNFFLKKLSYDVYTQTWAVFFLPCFSSSFSVCYWLSRCMMRAVNEMIVKCELHFSGYQILFHHYKFWEAIKRNWFYFQSKGLVTLHGKRTGTGTGTKWKV